MNREYHKWYSPSLGRDMELLLYGHAGAPVIIFPTSMGRFYQNEDMGLIGALSDKIENGFIQVYCVDSVDNESWYNYGNAPEWRVRRHIDYENYLLNEVIPLIGTRNSNGYLIVTGCSFGATQAVNFAFRHPTIVHKVVALSGRYSMQAYLDGYYDDNVYYNSPLDYIGGLQDGEYRHQLQLQEIYLIVGEWDLPVCLNETRQLHDKLDEKGIGNTLGVWNQAIHDWPDWKRQIREYI